MEGIITTTARALRERIQDSGHGIGPRERSHLLRNKGGNRNENAGKCIDGTVKKLRYFSSGGDNFLREASQCCCAWAPWCLLCTYSLYLCIHILNTFKIVHSLTYLNNT